MPTFGWIFTIIGGAAFSGQLLRLIERVDQPRSRRSAA